MINQQTIFVSQLGISATVTVYRGHRRTLYFLPGIISLIIMCIQNNENNQIMK